MFAVIFQGDHGRLSVGKVRFSGTGPGQFAVLLHHYGTEETTFNRTFGRILQFGRRYFVTDTLLEILPGYSANVGETLKSIHLTINIFHC